MALSLLHLPDRPSGVVVMVDAADVVAAALARLEFATLAADLKVDEEDAHDIGLLGRRVLDAIDWARKQPALEQMPVAVVGCAMGAPGALAPAPTVQQTTPPTVPRTESPKTNIHAPTSRGTEPSGCCTQTNTPAAAEPEDVISFMRLRG